MKSVLSGVALAWLAVAGSALVAQTGSPTTSSARPPQPRAQATPAAGPAQAAPRAAAPARPAVDEVAVHQAWINKNCLACHNNRAPQPSTEPVNLEAAKLSDVNAQAATWERVLRKLRHRAMPPQGMPHPPDAEYDAFTTFLSAALDRSWRGKSTPGQYVMHRLNRTEYGNAIRDLLGLEVDVTELLPSDGANFGFDNIASSLRTSPLLLERYLLVAQRISTMAVGDRNTLPGTTEYSISREFTQKEHIDGLPLGTRGGTKVIHVFPADGYYKLFGRLVRGVEEGYAGVEGQETPESFVVTLDGEEVYTAEIGGFEDHAVQAKDMNEAQKLIDARMSGRVFVTAGPHEVGYTWRERPTRQQDVWVPSLRDSQEVHMVGGFARLKVVGVEGPYDVKGVSNSASRQRIFVCQPTSAGDEAACATRIFTSLTRRAYRRPTTAEDTEAPMTFYRQARGQGGDFDAGIRAGLARVLSSPSFLYRIEEDPATLRAGAAHPVSDVELASRLSFFLWSSIPDEPLMRLATAGRLREPGVLAAQVRRMIADARSEALVSNFVGQWLQLRNLEAKVSPDLLLFPDFDDNIRKGFRKETEMLFAHILREGKSAMELLSADYTFVDERLAKHYRIPNVYGSRFRQVKLTDPNRFGLLGHGSVLSLTSVATRTSPVFRGKYVLTTFFNTPPPPPVPNVPTLEESNKQGAPKTVREQLERHRQNPTCASCHRMIDPVGFALEQFDSTGQWRTAMPDGSKLDTAGVLADGTKIDGPVALRNVILSRPESFATILTERLMTYALGRGVEAADMPLVRSITKRAALNNYRLSSIVQSIVESGAFQMRTKPVDTPTTNLARVQ
jgi:hypothetical protein